MKFESKYGIGDVVSLVTDEENRSRIISGVSFRPNGYVYYLSCGSSETVHYDIEIKKPEAKKTVNGFKS